MPSENETDGAGAPKVVQTVIKKELPRRAGPGFIHSVPGLDRSYPTDNALERLIEQNAALLGLLASANENLTEIIKTLLRREEEEQRRQERLAADEKERQRMDGEMRLLNQALGKE